MMLKILVSLIIIIIIIIIKSLFKLVKEKTGQSIID